jgi:hypothetical protein
MVLRERAAAPYATINDWNPTELSMLGLADEKLNGQVTFYNSVFVTESEQIRRSHLRHKWGTVEVGFQGHRRSLWVCGSIPLAVCLGSLCERYV